MAIVDVDPATLGSFVSTGIVLEHDDTVSVAQWTAMVENGARSFWNRRSAMSTSQAIQFETDLWSAIPPSNPSVYWSEGLSENAGLIYTIEWERTSGALDNGTVIFKGGTNIASLGTLGTYTTAAASGSVTATFPDAVVIPDYALSGGVVKTCPFFLKVESVNPGDSTMIFTQINLRYSKYPMIT